jgi:hypothetical protein
VSAFTYTADGSRVPFDPTATGAHLAGCLLCGRRVKAVGLFIPLTDAMHAVVLRLRQHPVPASSRASGIAYGLCSRCVKRADATDRVEAALVAAAAKVTVQ